MLNSNTVFLARSWRDHLTPGVAKSRMGRHLVISSCGRWKCRRPQIQHRSAVRGMCRETASRRISLAPNPHEREVGKPPTESRRNAVGHKEKYGRFSSTLEGPLPLLVPNEFVASTRACGCNLENTLSRFRTSTA